MSIDCLYYRIVYFGAKKKLGKPNQLRKINNERRRRASEKPTKWLLIESSQANSRFKGSTKKIKIKHTVEDA